MEEGAGKRSDECEDNPPGARGPMATSDDEDDDYGLVTMDLSLWTCHYALVTVVRYGGHVTSHAHGSSSVLLYGHRDRKDYKLGTGSPRWPPRLTFTDTASEL